MPNTCKKKKQTLWKHETVDTCGTWTPTPLCKSGVLSIYTTWPICRVEKTRTSNFCIPNAGGWPITQLLYIAEDIGFEPIHLKTTDSLANCSLTIRVNPPLRKKWDSNSHITFKWLLVVFKTTALAIRLILP